MENRILKDFLHNIQKNNKITMLEKYVDLLLEENQKINLISRKLTKNDIYIKHILDSVYPAKYYDFSDKFILDFGTGGGLPGIPIKILFPSSKIYFLDSVGKKIDAIKRIADKLNLDDVFFIKERLENLKTDKMFDIILSRSVKMEKKYLKKLISLLKIEGKILLYKTENMEKIVKNYSNKIIDVSNEYLNSRKIVEIAKNGKNNFFS